MELDIRPPEKSEPSYLALHQSFENATPDSVVYQLLTIGQVAQFYVQKPCNVTMGTKQGHPKP